MPKFLAIYTGSKISTAREEWDKMDDSARKARVEAGRKAWAEWGAKHASAIVDAGGPLGKTKRTTADGIRDASNAMGAYVIVEADSYDAAARMFENHPHFMIFPGDAVEVMECLPAPRG